MSSVYILMNQILSFGVIPYLLIAAFTISYFVYEKYLILVQIRNVSPYTIFSIDLTKVKKNLQIKSMIYNFILIISSIECVTFAVWGIISVYTSYQQHSDSYYNVVVLVSANSSCILQHTTLAHFIMNIATILALNVGTLVALFFAVLRRAFINYPYRRLIKYFFLYILLKSIFLIPLSYFLVTSYFVRIAFVPFLITDSYLYITSCRSFYILLKGRRDEAWWHSTRREYREKRKIAKHFLIAQYGASIVIFSIFIVFTCNILIDIIRMILESECLLHYAFGPGTPVYFQVPTTFQNSANMVMYYCRIVRGVFNAVMQLMFVLSHLLMLITIISKIIQRRKKFKHVNDWLTRPLMEKYRDTFNQRNSHFEGPPFIQAFRSNPL